MAEVEWVKLTTDMFDNRKIKYLRNLHEGEGNNIVLIWVMLLTMAGRCNSGGMIFLTENIPYTTKMLADELKFDENTVILALEALEELDMIVTDNGFLTIAGWEEYQNVDKLAEIRAKDRERKRLKKAQSKAILSKSTEIPRNIHGNSTDIPHTEEEGESEEEFHSFNPALSSPEYRRKYLGGIGKGVVFLSDEQMSDLLANMSLEEFNHYVGVVANEELKGHNYTKKTHYQAILDMAVEDRKVGK